MIKKVYYKFCLIIIYKLSLIQRRHGMGSGVENWENLPNIIPQREPNNLALSGRIGWCFILQAELVTR